MRKKKPTSPAEQARVTQNPSRRLLQIGFQKFTPDPGEDSILEKYTNYVYPDLQSAYRVELSDRGWEGNVHLGWYICARNGDASFQTTATSPREALEKAWYYPHCPILLAKLGCE